MGARQVRNILGSCHLKTRRAGRLEPLRTSGRRPPGARPLRRPGRRRKRRRALAFRSGRFMIGPMTEAEIAKLATWLAKAGLEGRSETVLVEGFCNRAVAGGLPLARVMMLIDTLHPIHEGRAFRWEQRKAGSDADRIRANRRGGGGGTVADKPSLPAFEQRRIGVASACDSGDRS